MLFIVAGSEGGLLRSAFFHRRDKRPGGSILNYSISLFMLVMARTKGDRTGLFSLFSNGPGVHVFDKGVVLLVGTRTEGYWSRRFVSRWVNQWPRCRISD